MSRRALDDQRTVALSGLWIACIGFFVTRSTVSLAAYESRAQFLLVGVVPLTLGLLLATVGVAFVVGSFDPAFVRTVAVWCTAGTLAMGVLVALTLFGSVPDGADTGSSIHPGTAASNFLIGGALLGAFTGVYAGRTRLIRAELRQQANRLVMVNRILRHEVLNAVSVIRGWSETLADPSAPPTRDRQREQTLRYIRAESDHIADTIESVKHLTRTAEARSGGLSRVDLGATVEECLTSARENHPDVTFAFEGSPTERVDVWADDQLSRAVYPLVENAATYNDPSDPEVTLEITADREVANLRLTDAGSGMSIEQRATLERGEIPDFDDPSAGFGTHIARMIVEGYGGEISTDVTDDGTTVEVSLGLGTVDPPSLTGTDPRARRLRSTGLDSTSLLIAVASSLVAGGVMGLFMQLTAGVIPIIGALYGVTDPLVGWLTHEFHSIVFGLIYAGLLVAVPGDADRGIAGVLGVAVGWSLFLWLVAAGVIMPAWLTLVGIPATVPSVTMAALQSHLLWGVTLGMLYYAGRKMEGDR